MPLRSLTPVLVTHDIPATIEFLTTVFGFVVTDRADEFAWARLRRDDVAVMLSGPLDNQRNAVPTLTGSLYIVCDDVDAEWRAINGRAAVCYEPETFHYGMREFGVYDNNGYLFTFGTPVPEPQAPAPCE